ncbi:MULTISPECIES: branched-chain amino acid ABC transporter permease [Rhizobium]|uniref:High-affinity branched-chain amino acid transport system permease protein braD n=1 Tax=Rhizobium favelukesii TaxID=348824 RepID=W6RRS7_9HYPH|nr:MULTISPECIES: branched-chain amino acid ABC transporter permease [Rhizobium]MCA0801227.1 branched-chain amino acid ABC transporter permease [Rhizobium sp. T1473]MCS0460941.1 branched-chain amino acid ABC transporter permease [Rhizobium favelukesii]UFS81230.1 branched-chain amino acid ABC transporter permease [Rhizobium sp. T136]CDM57096.1 High-affinity branched-chain amino acid transport system permease protein braD [Rhizobium favelukesii]
MAYLLQQLANAVPVAALYAALAFGYAIAFGVTKRADITYGAIFAFSGQILLLFTDLGYNRLWLILPAALALGALFSVIYSMLAAIWIGRSIMLPLVRQSSNTVIVAALGITIVLMETARLASDTKSLWLSPFLNSAVVFWSDGAFKVTLTEIQLINTGLMCAMMALGVVIMRGTSWGRLWRAVTDDPLAAELCGTSADRVFLIAYASAGLIATACGILATFYYGTMDFGAGLMFGLKVLMVAAVGGYSDPLKSAAGAAGLGVAETMWSAYGPYLWRDLVVFSLLVLLLVLSRRERAIP